MIVLHDEQAVAKMQKYSNVIMTPCRWEANSILEFVSFYKSIGFDHAYIYCNDDQPFNLYSSLLPEIEKTDPFVTFVYFGLQGQQRQMMLHWLIHYRHETERVGFFDADEFLCMQQADSIKALLDGPLGESDVLYFNWSSFGTNGHTERPEGSILLNYTRREVDLHPFTKILVRTSVFTDQWLAGNPLHDLMHGNSTYLDQFRCRNVIGRDMARYYETFPAGSHRYLNQPEISDAIRAVAVMNHYALRSEQDFLRRAARGLKGDYSGQMGWKSLWESGRYHETLEKMSKVEDRTLADYWGRRLGGSLLGALCLKPIWPNIGLGKHATQSSLSPWSAGQTVEEDAGNAVNGRICGRHQFHTGPDDPPWWQVDLGSQAVVREIRLFNRLDIARERARHVEVYTSADGQLFSLLSRRVETHDFGGADGKPFIWQGETITRYVRIALPKPDFLHLDQVEIYGQITG